MKRVKCHVVLMTSIPSGDVMDGWFTTRKAAIERRNQREKQYPQVKFCIIPGIATQDEYEHWHVRRI